MGKIGFVFEVFSHEVFEKRELFFDNNKIENKFIVIFVSTNKTNSDIIIGIEDFFHKEDSKLLFLNSDLGFNDYFIFENAIFKYSKICVYETKVIDYRDLTFWFEVKKYKEIRDLLVLNNLEGKAGDELRKRVLKLLEYF